MPLLLATSNIGKVLEISKMLGSQFELIGLGGSPPEEEIETGSTFCENALLKARHYYASSRLPTVADDSGLEVSYLGGAPGIFSARYGGSQASDSNRVARLLRELEGVPTEGRQARFVCCAALVWSGGEVCFSGEVEGLVATESRGSGGFGYDPIFYYQPFQKTFAEMAPDEKAKVSHRASAFGKLREYLSQPGLLDMMMRGDRIIDPTIENLGFYQSKR